MSCSRRKSRRKFTCIPYVCWGSWKKKRGSKLKWQWGHTMGNRSAALHRKIQKPQEAETTNLACFLQALQRFTIKQLITKNLLLFTGTYSYKIYTSWWSLLETWKGGVEEGRQTHTYSLKSCHCNGTSIVFFYEKSSCREYHDLVSHSEVR